MNLPLHQTCCISLEVEVLGRLCRELAVSLVALEERHRHKFVRALPDRFRLVREFIADAAVRAWETPLPHLFISNLAKLRFTELLANGQPAYGRAA